MQKKQTKKVDAANHNAGVSRLIPLSEIEPSPDNARKSFNEKKLAELVASIKQDGLWQPILVREMTAAQADGPKYRIVFGERRFRAATLAGLLEIPAYVKAMGETEALSAQLVENLQREDVHPLDEAEGFLRLKEELKLDVRGIAKRVAKDARHVARRLALTNLIGEGKEDFRKEYLTLAHVLEICRLAPEIQTEALAACYEVKSVQNKTRDGYDFVPDKTRPARHVRHLQDWLSANVHLNLQNAPFKLDDARLREDGLTCTECPQRTGRDKLLFADIKSSDTCLNPLCFQAKRQQFVQLTKAAVEAKQQGKPAVLISDRYSSSAAGGDLLGRDQYQILPKKADRCAYAEQSVQADGGEIGQVKWICREPGCKDHLGRVRESRSYSSGSAPSASLPEERHERKQELFDLKVDEAVRKRVMGEALNAFAWPLDRKHLNEAVKEFFRRIPASDQKTVCEVFGWNEETAGRVRFDGEAVLQELARLDDNQLARFLMLCSFAHYGANPDQHRRVDQRAVVQLSEACGVNHTLIDAQVRAELSPKKYRDTHQAYLKTVQSGQPASKPLVYEPSAQDSPSSQEGEEGREEQGPENTGQSSREQSAVQATA